MENFDSCDEHCFYIWGNAHAAIHLRTINQFLKLVYLRK